MKILAMVTPQSMAGVLEKMVSVATASFLCGVESWESGFEMFSHGESSGCPSQLSRVLRSLLDGISIEPTKMRV